MAGKEDKNKILSQSSVDPDEVSTTAAEKTLGITPENEKKRAFVTAGEKIHKWSTYLGIDWIFNTAVGVSFAYWGKFTESGKRIWSDRLDRGFTKLLGGFIKDESSLARSVEKGNIFMSIIAGGMFTIPPLLALENNKVKKSIVKFYDKMIYGKDKIENDPKFQQAYKEIEEAPKKDFWTGMGARFVALAPLLAIVLHPASRKFSDKVYFNYVAKGSENVAKGMGFGPNKFKGVSIAEGEKRWKFIHDSVAMDFGLGIPYAILHAFFYNMFANMFGKKKTPEQKTVPVENAPTATTADNSAEARTIDTSNQAKTVTGEANVQPASTFVGKISKDVSVIGRQAITSHDSHTDFAQKNTDPKLQAAL